MSTAADTPSDCSRAGCRAAAVWRIEWRNPKIHPVDRRKVWVACDAHRDFLRDYLAARDFPVSVSTLAPIGATAGGEGSQ
ncbi:hypothetical protein [Microbacterium sp.]|uniref:hypothetical protein n=1 Tax=Microbacterium sp. TaxID=51671 RepID=UPI002E301854|nr:hypothetical protein [Microbacterium sp.]HEX5729812.1 hypothetical protein [Microbacterium sp.]